MTRWLDKSVPVDSLLIIAGILTVVVSIIDNKYGWLFFLGIGIFLWNVISVTRYYLKYKNTESKGHDTGPYWHSND